MVELMEKLFIWWGILGVAGFLMLMTTKKRYVFLSEMISLFSTHNIFLIIITAIFYYVVMPVGIVSGISEHFKDEDENKNNEQ
jgi:hypothetical protein